MNIQNPKPFSYDIPTWDHKFTQREIDDLNRNIVYHSEKEFFSVNKEKGTFTLAGMEVKDKAVQIGIGPCLDNIKK